MTIAGPPGARSTDGLAIDIGDIAGLDDAVAAFDPTKRARGKTITRVRT